MPITELTFSVGYVVLTGFEVPETLDSLGGTQRIAEHHYPGGAISHQVYGAFPNHVSFRGLLTGTAALPRARELDRLRVSGQPVPLVYGGVTLLGIVSEFTYRPKHQWLVPYEMRFQPGTDLTTVGQFDGLLSLFSIVNDALVHLSAILSVVFSSSDGATHSASDAVVQQYMSLPPTMAPPLTALINDSFDALQAALGLPQDIPPNSVAQLELDAQALLAVAQPLAQSGDPTVASPAIDVIGYVNSLMSAVGSTSLGTITTLQVVNPNIRRIAAQYYGDATQWQRITDASQLPPDPQPIGEFALTIPAALQ